ncbi:MAG: hypothetical protein KA807_01310 [Prolixibacteraceae bacterium]|nr:hypothetical protein [Prolixibacteraceae bacterium]
MKSTLDFFKKWFVLKFFILGLSIAFISHFMGGCEKDEFDPYEPNELTANVTEIKKSAESIEQTFISGNIDSIKNVLTDEAYELYGTQLDDVDKDLLINFGNAIKQRELIFNSDIYAEFTYVKDRISYTFSMARETDGSWKLMRF